MILPVELNVTVPVPQLNVPLFVHVPATFMLALGAVNVPAMVMLLKALALEPEIALVPLKVMVLVPQVNMPLFIQLPDTLMLAAGAIKVFVMVTLLKKFVLEPDIVVVPLNVTVPVPQMNVPELDQLPATFMLALGAVRIFEMVMLLKALALEPEITLVPLNVTVPPLALNVLLFIQLPDTLMLRAGAVRVPVMVTLLKDVVADTVVVPLNITVLVPQVNVPGLVRPPAKLIVYPDAPASTVSPEAMVRPSKRTGFARVRYAIPAVPPWLVLIFMLLASKST